MLDDLMKKNGKNPVMMNTVWLLDDFVSEIGATRVVPGSHKSGMSLPPEEYELTYVMTDTAPGVVF